MSRNQADVCVNPGKCKKSVYVAPDTQRKIDEVRKSNPLFARMSYSAVVRELVYAGYTAMMEEKTKG